MKLFTNLSFYILVMTITITVLCLEWKDQPADASPIHLDNYYKVILDKASGNQGNLSLIDAPVIKQLPELPRGCEVTSLAMLLNHAGVKVDKMTLAKEIKKDPTPLKVIDGKTYFGNPNIGFVGSLYSFNEPGLGVYHKPIAELAARYLPNRIEDISGQPFGMAESYLKQAKPVWVIVSSTYKKIPDTDWMTWVTSNGEIRVTKKEHAVLLTGYDKSFVYFNDPLTGNKNLKINKKNFIEGWQQLGRQAISYK